MVWHQATLTLDVSTTHTLLTLYYHDFYAKNNLFQFGIPCHIYRMCRIDTHHEIILCTIQTFMQ